MKTNKLKFNPNNPRKCSKDKLEKLMRSIESFPEMMKLRPIVYDPETMQVLGGNQRLAAIRKLGMNEIPDEWAIAATDLTPEQQKEFVLRDNVQLGEWDFEVLSAEFAEFDLSEMGIDMPEVISPDDYGTEFDLPEGDKEPFQQMTFTLADAQAETIKAAIDCIKKDKPEIETFGNENSNGNALYEIVRQWAELKTL
jgi:hypothetical protein